MFRLRQFLRHPASVPIQYALKDVAVDKEDYLCNISTGGLCFRSKVEIDKGQMVHITIPVSSPDFEIDGVVAWSRKMGDHFEIGVQFQDTEDEFSVRMIEQVCYIEDYRRRVSEKEGRDIGSEQAALEWIERYAEYFPR